jgi:hypothetical protein
VRAKPVAVVEDGAVSSTTFKSCPEGVHATIDRHRALWNLST